MWLTTSKKQLYFRFSLFYQTLLLPSSREKTSIYGSREPKGTSEFTFNVEERISTQTETYSEKTRYYSNVDFLRNLDKLRAFTHGRTLSTLNYKKHLGDILTIYTLECPYISLDPIQNDFYCRIIQKTKINVKYTHIPTRFFRAVIQPWKDKNRSFYLLKKI